jgi:hypothetical protein
MKSGFVLLGIAGMACAMALGNASPAAAQQAPGQATAKTAEQQFKNIQVLTGVPADQVIPTMRVFTGALGVRCGFCHMDGDLASDMKPEKATARKMFTMMNAINKDNFAGRTQVTCYTCHNGHNDPANLIELPATEADEAPRPAMPTTDDIISKYIQAIGGEAAIRKVTSRVIMGTQDVGSGVTADRSTLTAQLERDQKAPNLLVNTLKTDKFTTMNGFDGTVAWNQDAKGTVNPIANPYQGRAKWTSDLYEPLDLKMEYPRLAVRGMQKVNGHDAYQVIGMPMNDTPERLFFDAQTGLLLRKITVTTTAAGNLPAQVDYDDYRDTGSGVKIPYTIHMVPITPGDSVATQTTIHIQKVQDNAAVDGSKFTKPESKAPAAAPAGAR